MSEHQHDSGNDNEIDADINGHLATALFIGVVIGILLVVYGMAMAA